MAKTKASKRKSNQTWSSSDHSSRTAKRIASLQKKQRKKLALSESTDDNADAPSQEHQQRRRRRPLLSSAVPSHTYKRTHLAHDNHDKIELSKLRLATSQIQRQVDALASRLSHWDPQSTTDDDVVRTEERDAKMRRDVENRRMDRQAREKAEAERVLIEAERGVNCSMGRRKANLRKKPRPGPETWKLRGAARPAWEVYDFDTRYVDPHIQAMEEHREKVKRTINVFTLCRGRFAQDSNNNDDKDAFPPPQPHCRTYLSLLTQLGSLHLTRKNYSSARSSFLSAIELEGPTHPRSITNARSQLMNMYLSTNRPASARKLLETLVNDDSAWIRYSAALLEYVSWNVLGEEGSSAEVAERALGRAIRGNVYLVYLLGWGEVFRRAMEYTEDVVEWGDGEGGSIMEAVEYYGWGVGVEDGEEEEEGVKGMGLWLATEGSLDWVQSVVLRVWNGESVGGEDVLSKADLLSWEAKLAKEEEAFEKERNAKESLNEGDSVSGEHSLNEEEEPDLLMYAGMFRTAMDWLQDAGEFLKSPTYNYIKEVEKKRIEDDSNVSSVEGDGDSVSDDSSSSSDSVSVA
eukprot:CCRYP_008367-RA/>CCRYP_008367-RA protein AED:0.03 eAED:0.03 QI:124/1/1/1/1/0.5/2/143/575